MILDMSSRVNLLWCEYLPMPPISSRQPPSHPPRNVEADFHARMWLMKLNATLDIQVRGRELPNRAV